MNPQLPIGIFDSGVGGLTVYQALRERLPGERFIYLGDTARVPYGTKSLATVERYGVENARFLRRRGIKLLVVACNTASALALGAIEQAAGVPVVGVIEPGARAAARAVETQRRRMNEERTPRIGVIATEATVGSGAYRAALRRVAPEVDVVEQACPLFVALAEEGWAERDVARMVAAEYLAGLRDQKVGALVLGCTHYPILRSVIAETIGAGVELIDSGRAAAEEVARTLGDGGALRTPDAPRQHGEGEMAADDRDHFYVTDAAERFARVACRFLGSAPAVLEAVEVWGDDRLES